MVASKTFNDQDWIENFRVSKATFTYLCQQLSAPLRRQDTTMCKVMSVERRALLVNIELLLISSV